MNLLRVFPYRLALWSLAISAMTMFVPETQAAEEPPLVAIFTGNRIGLENKDAIDGFRSALAAHVASLGWRVISSEDVAGTLRDNPDINLPEALANNASSVRLTEMLGAQFLLVADVNAFSKGTREYKAGDVATLNEVFTLRVAYRALSSRDGASELGGAFDLRKQIRQTPELKVSTTDVLDELLYTAAETIVADIRKKSPPTVRSSDDRMVKFTINTTLQGILIPDVLLDEKGNAATVSAYRIPVEVGGVTVELDGVAIGSAPGTFTARPGLHRLRLTRDGFQTWDRTVNLYDGFVLNASMDFNEAGMERWKQMAGFLQDLKSEAQLSAAEVERIRAAAQALRQSGYRLDVKVDTEQGVTIDRSLSIFRDDASLVP